MGYCLWPKIGSSMRIQSVLVSGLVTWLDSPALSSSSSEWLSFPLPPWLFQILLCLWEHPGIVGSLHGCCLQWNGHLFYMEGEKRALILCAYLWKVPPPGLRSTLSSLPAFFLPSLPRHSVFALGNPYCKLRVEFIDKVKSLGNWGLMWWFKCLGEAIIVASKITLFYCEF